MPNPIPETGASGLVAEVEYVFRVAYRLTGNAHDAEDLVQDVCERALRKAPDFAAADDRRRWLLRVLYNRFVDGRRRGQRSPFVADRRVDTEQAAAGADAPSPEDLAVQSERESDLQRAWLRLEPAQQMLLLLRAEGHDLAEMARITEIEKHALSSRLYRARSSLAKYLEEARPAERLCVVAEKAR